MEKYIFASLLHIDTRNFGSPNNKNNSPKSYLRQIRLLNSTLHQVFGLSLVVFTNDKNQVHNFFTHSNHAPTILSYTPSFEPPINLPFFGAHFKLQALKEGLKLLRSSNTEFFCLLDCDVIANLAFSEEQEWLISKSDIAVYDISDQVFPTYGVKKIWENLELVGGNSYTNPQWFGGEFLMATEKGLNELIIECEKTLSLYLEHHSVLHHSGDEMFVSAALNNIIKKNSANVVEIGSSKIVGRHWAQLNYISFTYFKSCNFVHCPGSKQVLELLSNIEIPQSLRLFILRAWHGIVRLGRIIRGL